MKRTAIRILLSSLLLGVLLAGCAPAAVPLAGTERDSVLTFSEPKTDTQLSALVSGDYPAFIKDCDDGMKKATTDQSFFRLRRAIFDNIGTYQSREVSSVLRQGVFYIVAYNVKFEGDDQVKIQVAFDIGGDHKIAGLWFDSKELRRLTFP